jgi:hypothetical protein
MEIDPEYLRQQYSLLSDEALLAVNRADLVDVAQQCYDAELKARGLASPRRAWLVEAAAPQHRLAANRETKPLEEGEKPEWLDEAAEVFSRAVRRGTQPEDDVADARDAIEAAGIPCYVHLERVPAEKEPRPEVDRWQVLVPGNLNLRATNILDRDIFNNDFEAEWRTLLETFSDDEVRAMNPRVVFCGLFDRIERVTRVYEEEIRRRRLSD